MDLKLNIFLSEIILSTLIALFFLNFDCFSLLDFILSFSSFSSFISFLFLLSIIFIFIDLLKYWSNSFVFESSLSILLLFILVILFVFLSLRIVFLIDGVFIITSCSLFL